MPRSAIHTVPVKEGGWTNEREGSDEGLGSYTTKAEAQAAGRDLARLEQTEHIIHTKDGRISARKQLRQRSAQPRGLTPVGWRCCGRRWR